MVIDEETFVSRSSQRVIAGKDFLQTLSTEEESNRSTSDEIIMITIDV